MAGQRLLPDAATLKRHIDAHWTYADIAAEYGVSEVAVYQQLKAAGLIREKRTDHSALIPWKVAERHYHTLPCLMLRCLSRRNHGQTNPANREQMLDRWLARMAEEGLVVCYDPDKEPNPASPKHGGFYYAKRRASDGESIIRVPRSRRR